MRNDVYEQTLYDKMHKIIKRALSDIAPGMYSMLTSMAIARTGQPFEMLLLERTQLSYALLREYLGDPGADIVFVAILSRVLRSDNKAREVLDHVKRGCIDQLLYFVSERRLANSREHSIGTSTPMNVE